MPGERHNALAMGHGARLPLSVVVVTHRKESVLCNTLRSYESGGLLSLVERAAVYCNDGSVLARAVCSSTPITCVPRPKSDSLAGAQNQAAVECSSEYVLFLEDDFFLLSAKANTRQVLEDALSVLEARAGVETVRLRHRERPGHPLHSSWFKGKEDVSDSRMRGQLLDCVHWYETPESRVPQVEVCDVDGLAGDWYAADHPHACYTNNPCLYRRDWWMENIMPHNRGSAADNENLLQEPWLAMKPFQVAHGPGLFSHWDFQKFKEATMESGAVLERSKQLEDYLRGVPCPTGHPSG